MQVTYWTDEMLAERCREMSNDPTFKGMERQGRGLTQIELYIVNHWEKFGGKVSLPDGPACYNVSPDE